MTIPPTHRGPARSLLAACLACSLAAAASQAQVIVNIGELSLNQGSTPSALSADGTTVVGWANNGTTYRAFRWRAGSGIVDLGAMTSDPTSGGQAYAVNADGSVVVGYGDAAPGGTHAFRWTSAGGMVNLGSLMLPNGGSYAQGVSPDGATVVGYAPTANGFHAFRWTAGAGMQDVTTPASLLITNAAAINANGTVLVGTTSTTGGFRAAMFVGGSVQSLGNIAGTHTSNAVAVSSDGATVACYADNANAAARATRWTAATGMVDLGTLPTGYNSHARSISADGKIIVGDSAGDFQYSHGFLWTTAGGMVDVNTYLVSRGVNLAGWTLLNVKGVTNGATAMTGDGVINGRTTGWYITGLSPLVACPADLGGVGGVPPGDGLLDNNDFIVYINLFFNQSPQADIGRVGGVAGSDGLFDNNDFIVFINQFFAGC